MDNFENNNNFPNNVPKRQNDIPMNQQDDSQNEIQVPMEEKKKKPFYKKWWIWLIIVLVIAAIVTVTFLMLYNKKDSSEMSTQKNNSSVSSSVKMKNKSKKDRENKKNSSSGANTQPNSSAASGNKSTSNAAVGKTGSALEVFNSILIGDTATNGNGGVSEAELQAKLGNPQKTEELTYEGKSAKKETWGSVVGLTQGSGTMVILVQDGDAYRAVSKTSVGISGDPKKAEFTLDQYNQLQIANLSSEQAVQTLGQPNAMTTSLINGTNFTSYTWNTSVKGEKDAFFTIAFTNNIATTKDQQGLK
ncbi:DUF3862 domain-containing protein [Xylocopilactobacillus apicola]|uniref:DUF3862 domain-containing protein n=1 Tax=Xylocopilactobacillus apicola TaxID=2932184 RepID=A0AAU9DDV0_9LACO|nr:DUF3862 domain-containing protein [Xylocopilactobacillus apicola]BDR59012.1 hypothetical protein XA3_14530 [Xylocopilactobacillus apicola]